MATLMNKMIAGGRDIVVVVAVGWSRIDGKQLVVAGGSGNPLPQ
jgi:hypothetical protein